MKKRHIAVLKSLLAMQDLLLEEMQILAEEMYDTDVACSEEISECVETTTASMGCMRRAFGL